MNHSRNIISIVCVVYNCDKVSLMISLPHKPALCWLEYKAACLTVCIAERAGNADRSVLHVPWAHWIFPTDRTVLRNKIAVNIFLTMSELYQTQGQRLHHLLLVMISVHWHGSCAWLWRHMTQEGHTTPDPDRRHWKSRACVPVMNEKLTLEDYTHTYINELTL